MRGPLEFLFLCRDLDKMIFEVLAGCFFCHGTGRGQDIQSFAKGSPGFSKHLPLAPQRGCGGQLRPAGPSPLTCSDPAPCPSGRCTFRDFQ